MIHICPDEVVALMQVWNHIPVVYHHGKELVCKCICHVSSKEVECDEPECDGEHDES